MGACFGKKDSAAAAAAAACVVVPASCHPYRFGNGVVLRLFGAEFCPLTSRIRIALQHKCLAVDTIWVPPEGLSSSKLDEWLASVCPEGTIPILQHGNSVVYGSADDVVEYIESTFSDPRLIPEGSSGMDVQDWVEFVKESFTPLVRQLLYDPDPSVQEEVTPKLEAAFAKLDRGLWENGGGAGGKGPGYFMGQDFSMVDVYLIPFLELLRPLSYFRGVEIRSVHSNLLAYIKRMHYFPSYAPVKMDPDLLEMSVSRAVEERAPPVMISFTQLQHRSILWHIGRVVELAEELSAAKMGSSTVSPVKASLAMKIKRLSSEYLKLVEVMQEHAQMEERIIFPVLDSADRGLTELVQADHGRDLPIMNGIREDLKSVMALQHGSCIHNEALVALATRLKMFQESTREHFEEEDRDILPLLETVGFGSKQQEGAVESCLVIMESAHGRLLPYLLAGLKPHEVYQYMRIVQRAFGEQSSSSPPPLLKHIIRCLSRAGDEYSAVWKLVEERMPALAKLAPQEAQAEQQKDDEELSVATARVSFSISSC